MDRDLLGHLPIVLTVARLRGFAAAASALNMSPSAVSHAVRTVEDRLGEPLFARTTRSVAVTEAGERFITLIRPAFDDVERAFEAMTAARGNATGVLRISAPRIAFSMALTPILVRLAKTHPRLVVEAHAHDAFLDIVAEGFDAGVRLGEAVQQDMATVRLTPPFQSALVASPGYVEERGAPATIAELVGHNLIGFRMLGSGALYEWEFSDGEKEVTVASSGSAVVADASVARELALAGVGVAYLYEPLVADDVRKGRLLRLLPKASVREDGLFLYFPSRSRQAPKLRAFIEVAKLVSASRETTDWAL
jgi:DNA-binding transcriptional LysR family regulator